MRMVPKIDYKRQISLMDDSEFERFVNLMNINVGTPYYSPYLDARKKKVADTISMGYYRLRNDEQGFRRFERLLTEAIYKATIEK